MGLFSFDGHGLSRKSSRTSGHEPRKASRRRRAAAESRATGSRAAANRGPGQVESLEQRQMLAFDLVAAYAQSSTPFYLAGTVGGTTP